MSGTVAGSRLDCCVYVSWEQLQAEVYRSNMFVYTHFAILEQHSKYGGLSHTLHLLKSLEGFM